MIEKRPIDHRREAATSVEVGVDGDASPITGIIAIGGTLHVVKSAGIPPERRGEKHVRFGYTESGVIPVG